ncbi:MAG TPA: hypothetical protein VKZ18_15550 [Polyangia bacterium]|nr:hypothetical protein [Polyangia bacterium]
MPMSLTPSPLARVGRVALGLAVAAAVFGPSLAVFATSHLEVPAPTRPPIEVIAARPFARLAAGGRPGAAPLRVGPIERTPGLVHEAPLRDRMNDAAARCVVRSSRYLVLAASVDGRGRLTAVQTEAGDDRALADCAATRLREAGPVETRGPGTLEIGYFMGRSRG